MVDINLKCQSLLVSWLHKSLEGQDRLCNHFILYYIGRQLGFNNNSRPNANLPNRFYRTLLELSRKFKLLKVPNQQCKVIYTEAVKTWISPVRPRCVDTWRSLTNGYIGWPATWKVCHTKITDPVVGDFNWRVLHRIIPVNSRLQSWGMRVSLNCPRCNGATESLEHATFRCPDL